MKAQPLIVYLPDRRDIVLADRYAKGNNKIGPDVFTYSRFAGFEGTCPGATRECEDICYAKRIQGLITTNYENNSVDEVPPIPAEAKLLRIHVSGDFSTYDYIVNWIAQLAKRPDVTAWAYTRSWRVPGLVPALEALRALPNMQLFASMDASTPDLPPLGWRRAWILRTTPKNGWPVESRLDLSRQYRMTPQGATFGDLLTRVAMDDTASYVCPEETGVKRNCQECRYCFDGQVNDVTFLEH